MTLYKPLNISILSASNENKDLCHLHTGLREADVRKGVSNGTVSCPPGQLQAFHLGKAASRARNLQPFFWLSPVLIMPGSLPDFKWVERKPEAQNGVT